LLLEGGDKRAQNHPKGPSRFDEYIIGMKLRLIDVPTHGLTYRYKSRKYGTIVGHHVSVGRRSFVVVAGIVVGKEYQLRGSRKGVMAVKVKLLSDSERVKLKRVLRRNFGGPLEFW
jgi:hypothetical protein